MDSSDLELGVHRVAGRAFQRAPYGHADHRSAPRRAAVIELMLNPDGRVWVDRAGEGMSLTETVMTPSEAEGFLRFVATESGATLTRDNPTLAGTLPHWEARVQGWMPPAVSRPAFNIRKPSSIVITLDDYVEKQVITSEQRDSVTHSFRPFSSEKKS